MSQTVDTVALNRVNLEIEEAWSGSQIQTETGFLETATLDALYDNQKNILAPAREKIVDPTKDHDVDVYWYDFCNTDVKDCSDDACGDLTGPQAPVNKKGYKITKCLDASFSMNEADFHKSFLNKDDYVKKNTNIILTSLVNKLNEKALIFLHANAGVLRSGLTANASGQYEKPLSAFADSKILLDMLFDATVSKIASPFLLDGKNLWKTDMLAKLNAGNSDGKGDAALVNLLGRIQHDPLGFSKLPDLAASTFLVSPGAYALETKNYIPNTVPTYDEAAHKWKYNIPLERYGAKVDVFMQRVCINAAKNLYKYVWLFKLHYDFFSNPFGCADANGKVVTGIAEYKAV